VKRRRIQGEFKAFRGKEIGAPPPPPPPPPATGAKVGRGGDRFWAGDVRELYLSGERPIRVESVPTGSGVGGLCDRGGGSCPCGGNKGSVLLVFATGL